MLGRKLMMKFTVNCKLQQFKGIVNAYDGLTGKYGVYFPCDKQTVYILEDDKDIRFCDWQPTQHVCDGLLKRIMINCDSSINLRDCLYVK